MTKYIEQFDPYWKKVGVDFAVAKLGKDAKRLVKNITAEQCGWMHLAMNDAGWSDVTDFPEGYDLSQHSTDRSAKKFLKKVTRDQAIAAATMIEGMMEKHLISTFTG